MLMVWYKMATLSYRYILYFVLAVFMWGLIYCSALFPTQAKKLPWAIYYLISCALKHNTLYVASSSFLFVYLFTSVRQHYGSKKPGTEQEEKAGTSWEEACISLTWWGALGYHSDYLGHTYMYLRVYFYLFIYSFIWLLSWFMPYSKVFYLYSGF